jgi:hypothetical protein
MENTWEEEFPLLVVLVLFLVFFDLILGKIRSGKPPAPQKAVVFSLTPCYTPRHTLFHLRQRQ